MTETEAKFLSGSLFRHVTVMSLTASLGLMAVFAVDFVDMIFISMLGKAELAAAIGYAGAILFFTGSFGIGMAIAAGALVARALGQGDEALARRRTTSSMLIGVALGAAFAAVIWFKIEPLVTALGARGETRDLAVSFMQLILPSLPVLLIGVVGGAVLRAHGDARRSMMVMILGGLVNAALDPVLIFGLGLELTGAALASIAARFTIAVLAVRAICRHHGGFDTPRIVDLVRDMGIIIPIAAPAVLTQLATPVGQAYVTRAMAEYGEEAVAGMAIVGRLIPVAFAVLFALSGAVGPIIGQNAGAGQQDRVKGALRDALIFSALVTVLVAAALFSLRGTLETLFVLDGVARDLVFLFAGPLALLWFFNGVIFVGNAAFNNLGNPYYSTWINWGRNTLGTIPFVAVGAWFWGAPGVLIGQALGGVVFGIVALWLSWRVASGPIDPAKPSAFTSRSRMVQLFHGRR